MSNGGPGMGIPPVSKPLMNRLPLGCEVGKQNGPPKVQSSSGPRMGLQPSRLATQGFLFAGVTPSPPRFHGTSTIGSLFIPFKTMVSRPFLASPVGRRFSSLQSRRASFGRISAPLSAGPHHHTSLRGQTPRSLESLASLKRGDAAARRCLRCQR